MPQRLYRPLADIERIPKNMVESAYSTISGVIDIFNPKRNEFIPIGPITIIRTDLKEPIKQVKVSTNEKSSKSKDTIQIPEEMIITLERLRVEQDLTQKEINQIKKELKNKEVKNLEINKRIEHLEQKAKILGDKRRKNKIKQKFERHYENFFGTLNDDLLDLDDRDKQDIKVRLEDMYAIIQTTITRLEK